MSKKVNFYLVSMNFNNNITDYPAYEFLQSIENIMFGGQNNGNVVRKIQDKTLRMFPFHYTGNRRQFVTRLEKLKKRIDRIG